MTVNVVQQIDNLNWNLAEWTRALNTLQQDLTSLDADLEEALQNQLLVNFVRALDSIPEYSDNEVLKEHLLENIAYGPHVKVKNGVVTKIFDTSYAGTWEDVRRGQIAAWALSPKSPSDDPYWRSFWWRIIYTGSVPASKKWKKFDPSLYDRIIEARMEAWGEKAPYWMFVEYGTSAGGGEGTPYPSFVGKRPVYKTRAEAQKYVEMMIRDYVDSIEDTLAHHVYETFVDNRVPERVIIQEIQVRWTKAFKQGKYMVQLEQTAAGKFTGKRKIVRLAD